MKLLKPKGFTLIELLVVIVIIGILATLATVALGASKVKARDAKRISDIKQMQTALELYYNEESTYPPTTALTAGQALVGAVSGKTFMGKIPAGPSSGETYIYNQINGGTSYTLGYTLEKPVNEFAAGAAIALPGSINNQCLPNCGGKYCGDADGCGGRCTNVPTLSVSGTLTCDTTAWQLKCGTTVVTSLTKINQCSGNTASCSSVTCTGAKVCDNLVCKDPCTVDADCTNVCQKCSSGFCVNQTASEDLKNECDGTIGCLTGNCNGSGACGYYTSGKNHCSNCQECNSSGACVGCSICCRSDNVCGTNPSATIPYYVYAFYCNTNIFVWRNQSDVVCNSSSVSGYYNSFALTASSQTICNNAYPGSTYITEWNGYPNCVLPAGCSSYGGVYKWQCNKTGCQ